MHDAVGIMEQWRKYFITTYGFVESLFFGGCLFGWPSLLLILQKEGIYGYVCLSDLQSTTTSSPPVFNVSGSSIVQLPLGQYDTDNKSISQMNESLISNEMEVIGCNAQRVEMTLVYTFAAVAYGITAIFIGMSLEILGLRLTRLTGSTLLCSGFVILALTTPERSWFLWPALTLIALGSNQLRFSAFQFADLLPAYRATILTSYSSAYAISTTFFILMQLIYEATVHMKSIFLACGAIAALTYIPTFFMPIHKIEEKKQGDADKGGNAEHCQEYQNINGEEQSNLDSDALKEKLDDSRKNDGEDCDSDEGQDAHKDIDNPENSRKTIWIGVLESVFSTSGILHMYWHFVNLFLVLFYSSTFNIWASKVTPNSSNVSFYIKMSGVCCLIAPFFIPFSGFLTDYMIKRANKRRSATEKMAYTMQAPTFSMFGATICLGLVMICKLFFNEIAIYLSLILIALARPAIIGSCTAYIRLRFPAEQFNILNGIFTTVISIICFVQYPIMKWMTSSDEAYSQVHWLLLISLFISLISPGHMMVKRNAMRYARNRITAGQ